MTDLQSLLEAVDAGIHLDNDTLAASQRKKIFAKQPATRHTLWVKNKSTTDNLFLKSSDSSTARRITIDKNSEKSFEYHYVAILQDEDDPNIKYILGHCEWSEDVYLENSSAVNTIDYEAMEVF